ncbi:hypothetical protein BW730_07310 [Tessaracoccus aquimaris]|uniref:HTH luxR-type domain-containing protein n=1 Tax=Tessaracoccus aquimaris TaxID=1332264 RepID=A0A1Q2CMQ4_9ACTN|nr:response regulator transcription factor [Tessaracoccus aquimaris]AQP47335.1 hypothetical protein BW730_07310 [Tessaracoccus aquimaris]
MSPIRVALLNDYDVVVHGLKGMLRRYGERVEVAALAWGATVDVKVDITLFDTFGESQRGNDDVARLLADPDVGHLVVFTWNLVPQLAAEAVALGCSGYLDKSMTALELVEALEAIAQGEIVVSEAGREVTSESSSAELSWPGSEYGLSPREAEVMALITQGLTNQDIASRSFLSINSIKSYIRSAYRKIGVARRSQAVRWGLEHGMLPNSGREYEDRRR